MRAIHSPHGTMRSICARNSFLCVRTFANSSLNADIVICLSMRKLYHIFRNSAQIFFVRFCPKSYNSKSSSKPNWSSMSFFYSSESFKAKMSPSIFKMSSIGIFVPFCITIRLSKSSTFFTLPVTSMYAPPAFRPSGLK